MKVVITGKDKRHAATQTIYIAHPGISGRQFYYLFLGKTVVAVPAELKCILKLGIAVWTVFHCSEFESKTG
jgi:hypothetical protein